MVIGAAAPRCRSDIFHPGAVASLMLVLETTACFCLRRLLSSHPCTSGCGAAADKALSEWNRCKLTASRMRAWKLLGCFPPHRGHLSMLQMCLSTGTTEMCSCLFCDVLSDLGRNVQQGGRRWVGAWTSGVRLRTAGDRGIDGSSHIGLGPSHRPRGPSKAWREESLNV